MMNKIRHRKFECVYTNNVKRALSMTFDDAVDLSNKLAKTADLAVVFNAANKQYNLQKSKGNYLEHWEKIST